MTEVSPSVHGEATHHMNTLFEPDPAPTDGGEYGEEDGIESHVPVGRLGVPTGSYAQHTKQDVQQRMRSVDGNSTEEQAGLDVHEVIVVSPYCWTDEPEQSPEDVYQTELLGDGLDLERSAVLRTP